MRRYPLKYAKTQRVVQILMYSITFCLIFLCIPKDIDAKIVFASSGGLHVMEDNGRSRRRITRNRDTHPCWSPDGKRIAYERYIETRPINIEIFVMDADGTNQTQLTQTGGKNTKPTWSPDGKHLAFSSDRNGSSQIFQIDLDNLNVKQLTVFGEQGSAFSPDWSPDGNEIIYRKSVRVRNGILPTNVWIMSADGTNHRPFVPDPTPEDPLLFRNYPHWSPDGREVLFSESIFESQDNYIKRFVIIHKHGRRIEIDRTKMIDSEIVLSHASWMNNGRAILFSANVFSETVNTYHDIYQYDIVARTLKQLTYWQFHDMNGNWTEGPLPVLPQRKIPIQWGEIKADLRAEPNNRY